MTVPRVDLYKVFKRVVAAQVSAPAGTFTAVLDDPKRSPGEIFSAVQAADDQVGVCIAETKDHGYRSLFLADSASLTHGDTLPDHLGAPGPVRIKYVAADSDYKRGMINPALSVDDIVRWRRNIGGIYGPAHDAANSSLSGYFLFNGEEVNYTGADLIVKLANYTRLSREVTDGAMNSASKNLTSATAVFTSADATGAALVDGAGASGIPLVSRIDAFTNSTTVALRDANASGGNISAKTVLIAKLQSPESFEDTVFCLSTMNLLKRGDNAPFAAWFARESAQQLADIKAGAMSSRQMEMPLAA